MKDLIEKYQNNCLRLKIIINSENLNQIFTPQELQLIYNNFSNNDNFIQICLKQDDFEKKNSVMFALCKGCNFYSTCSKDKSLKCRNNTPYVDFPNIEFVGNNNNIKWFYLNALLYLNDNEKTSKVFGSFYILFKKVKKIKLLNKVVILYSDTFGFYERVKNSDFLSYQGNIVETFLSQLMHFISGEYCEFYFDNITNDGEVRNVIEDKMYNSLNNHKYLRQKFKFTIARQHIVKDAFGNVLFTLDMLLNIENKFKLCIECDGYNYHSSPERFDMDRLRDRTLLKQGIYTARFSSHDINYRLSDSLVDIVDIIEFHIHQNLFK